MCVCVRAVPAVCLFMVRSFCPSYACVSESRGVTRGEADATGLRRFSGPRHETSFLTPGGQIFEKRWPPGGRETGPARGPVLGAGGRKMAPFFATGRENGALEATAVWTWSNFLHDRVPSGLTPLRVNFDETGIRYFEDTRQGHLTEATFARRRSRLCAERHRGILQDGRVGGQMRRFAEAVFEA